MLLLLLGLSWLIALATCGMLGTHWVACTAIVSVTLELSGTAAVVAPSCRFLPMRIDLLAVVMFALAVAALTTMIACSGW